METHTKTPWAYKISNELDNTGGIDCCIFDAKKKIIAECFQNVDYGDSRDSEANARHIVHCVNLHDELVILLQELSGYFSCKETEVAKHYLNRIKQALQKAEIEE